MQADEFHTADLLLKRFFSGSELLPPFDNIATIQILLAAR